MFWHPSGSPGDTRELAITADLRADCDPAGSHGAPDQIPTLLIYAAYWLARPILPVGHMLLAEPGRDSFSAFRLLAPVSDVLVAVSGKPPKLAHGPPEYDKRCGGCTGHYPGEHHEEFHLGPFQYSCTRRRITEEVTH